MTAVRKRAPLPFRVVGGVLGLAGFVLLFVVAIPLSALLGDADERLRGKS